MSHTYLDIAPEVETAVREGQAVVALESTIIAHGMPYPRNVETAHRVEKVVREYGAVPATIAVLNGRLKAGLSPQEIDHLGEQGKKVIKTSRRDLPFIVSGKLDGATTVASTMLIADMAGIRVFATGGIGGVHRNATRSMDVSADLQELARTNMAVVSAGAKSILDLELTLEYLETHSVPVIGFQTDDFPAFYARTSGYPVQYRIDTLEALARTIKAKWELGLAGGLLIANPIPEKDALAYEDINRVIREAIAEADARRIRGKQITPFLLARIEELTGGRSLAANIELVLNNARLAARLAVEIS